MIMTDSKHYVYYITNQQTYSAPPTFPIPSDGFVRKGHLEFNVLTISDIRRLKILDDTQIQKVIVLGSNLWRQCHKHICGKTSYCRIQDLNYSYYIINPVYVFPLYNHKPMYLKDFAKTDIYIKELTICIEPDMNIDSKICYQMIDHGVKLSEIKSCTQEIAEYAVKKFPENLEFIEDKFITDSIRTYIATLDKRWHRIANFRPNFIKEKKHNINVNINAAKNVIYVVTKSKITHVDINNYIDEKLLHFDILYILKDVFIDWLKKYFLLPENCEYKLDSIGYADESYAVNPWWKNHLKEVSKYRLNITESCCINSGKDLNNFIKQNPEIIKFIHDIGLNIIIYERCYWRRGSDIIVKKINNDQSYDNCDYSDSKDLNIFIINPEIKETDKKEPVVTEDSD